MPDDESPSPPRDGGKAGFLTRKLGPLPVWGWAIAVVAVALIVYKRRQSSTAPATTAVAAPGTIGSGAVTPNSSNGYAQDLSTQLKSLQDQLLASQQGSGNPQYTNVSGETPAGSGYGGVENISTPQGFFSHLVNWSQVQGILNSGGSVYYQNAPGNFTLLPPGWSPKDLAPGTALYQLLQNPISGAAAPQAQPAAIQPNISPLPAVPATLPTAQPVPLPTQGIVGPHPLPAVRA